MQKSRPNFGVIGHDEGIAVIKINAMELHELLTLVLLLSPGLLLSLLVMTAFAFGG